MYETKLASEINLPYFRTHVNMPIRNRTFSDRAIFVPGQFLRKNVASSHEVAEAKIGTSAKGYLFCTARGRSNQLSDKPMHQADVYRMVSRRSEDAGVRTKICCHSFRATGITEYLRNGGKLKVAQQMANHESARTKGLYDRRKDQISLDEVERILI